MGPRWGTVGRPAPRARYRPPIMGRHPDPRRAAESVGSAAVAFDAVADADPPPRRGRRARAIASRVLAVALIALLGGWAALAVAGALTAGGPGPFAFVFGPTPGAALTVASPPTSATPDATRSPVAGSSTSPAPTTSAQPSAPPPLTGVAVRPRVSGTPLEERLQAELDRIRRRLAIPGVSATIILRDGMTWTGTSGLADVKRKVPVEPDTAFALGSVSKTYTAALVAALAGDGSIDLDAPAVTYLTGRPLDRRITVRMLLDHTSGLDDFFLHGSIDVALQKDPKAAWSAKRTLRYVAKPYFPPGTGWHYSNTNYLYLGLIAEAVTGKPLGQALRDRFFGPLRLDATWYQTSEKARTGTAHGYRFVGTSRSARPIDLADGTGVMPFTSVVTAAGGAGSIAATSPDAARWARQLYTGKVLDPDMTAQMLSGVALTAAYSPRVPYGLGVQAISIDGRQTLGHSGRLLGFRAAVRHIPGESTTIAVLTNQSRADPGVIVEGLLRVVFAPDPPCFRCQGPS